MKRLLVITYYWPPTGGSGVQRWVKFCKYLPEFGWQPVVYTPANPSRLATDASLLSDIPECAEVLKTRIFEPYELYSRLTGGSKSEVNPVNASQKGLFKRFSLWARGMFFIPDPRVSWVRPSVHFLLKYLKEHPVDAIVTTGPPQSMHLIGLELKRKLGVKWIADFRDPWTEIFYYKHLNLSPAVDAKHRKLEQAVLDEADAVIAVSPPVRDDFAAATSTPVHLITNGFDLSDFEKVSLHLGLADDQQCAMFTSSEAERQCDTSKKVQQCIEDEVSSKVQQCAKIGTSANQLPFRVVHTGLFASDGNPINLWTALSELCAADPSFRSRLEIRLAGKTDAAIVDSIRAAGLADNLRDLGYLPHAQIIEEQRNASVLILPLRREKEYAKVLPGKIFEYLASSKPILGIGQSDGAAASVLRDAQAGTMFDWDSSPKELCNFLISKHPNTSDISKYTRYNLTAQLSELLNQITNQ